LLAVSVMSMTAFLIAGLSFSSVVVILARIGKADPQMR